MATEPASYEFVSVASLYRRVTPSGKTVYFGKLFRTRIYLWPLEPEDDTQPAFDMQVRAEEYDPRGIR